MNLAIRALAMAGAILAGAAAPALAATVSTGDLGNNVIDDAGDYLVQFDLGDVAEAGAATLDVIYGLWNSPDVLVDVLVNGISVGDVLADVGYISPGPELASFDVSGLLVDGVNSILFTGGAANPGDYVVGQVDLTYVEAAVVPLPASLPLLGAGLLAVAALRRRRAAA